MPDGARRELQSVQVLRALAALGVVVMHVRNELVNRAGLPLPDLLVGAAGVDVFFVISGFVMVYSSTRLFGRPDAPAIFITRRLGRIVPLYWICTAVTAALFVVLKWTDAAAQVTPANLLRSFLFIPYARPDGTWLPILEVGWTLNFEMMFYAMFALAILLSARSAVWTLSAVMAACVLVGRSVALPLPFSFWCNPIILEFCFGMWLALAHLSGLRLARWLSHVLFWGGIAAFGLGYLIPPATDLRPLVWGLPAAAIVAAAVLTPDRARSPVLVYLGAASYSLYLVHVPALIVVASAAAYLRIDVAAWWPLYAAVLGVAVIALPVAVHVAIERPIVAALRRYADAPARPSRVRL